MKSVTDDLNFEEDASATFGVVSATEAGNIVYALLVDVHVTGVAFHALVYEPIEERTAVVAEGGTSIRVDTELVLAPRVIGVGALVCSRAGEGDELMAPLMYHKTAHLALKSLLSKSPDEVRAVAAEGRLLEKSCDKFMIFNFMNIFLTQSTFPCKTICNLDKGIVMVKMVSHSQN